MTSISSCRSDALLFREEMMDEAREFFEVAARESKDLPEASACLGYVNHRLGNDDAALMHLRRALQLDGEHTEARIYLANILYDRGEYEAARESSGARL